MNGWVDCTQVITGSLPQPSRVPGYFLRGVRTFACDRMSMQFFGMLTHHGTHIDAPSHFIDGGRTIEELGIDSLCGEGVVIDMRSDRLGRIDASRLSDQLGSVASGDIVFIRTGWSRFYGRAEYAEGPFLDAESAELLVARGIKLLGVDTLSPDEPPHNGRPESFGYPVHRVLLGAGVPIAENLRLEGAAEGRQLVMAMPIPIGGGDGAPARVALHSLADGARGPGL